MRCLDYCTLANPFPLQAEPVSYRIVVPPIVLRIVSPMRLRPDWSYLDIVPVVPNFCCFASSSSWTPLSVPCTRHLLLLP